MLQRHVNSLAGSFLCRVDIAAVNVQLCILPKPRPVETQPQPPHCLGVPKMAGSSCPMHPTECRKVWGTRSCRQSIPPPPRCLPPPVDHAVVELQAAPLRMKRLDLGALGRHSWPVRMRSGTHQHSVICLLLPQLLSGERFSISTAGTRPYCCRRRPQSSFFLTTAVPSLISEA